MYAQVLSVGLLERVPPVVASPALSPVLLSPASGPSQRAGCSSVDMGGASPSAPPPPPPLPPPLAPFATTILRREATVLHPPTGCTHPASWRRRGRGGGGGHRGDGRTPLPQEGVVVAAPSRAVPLVTVGGGVRDYLPGRRPAAAGGSVGGRGCGAGPARRNLPHPTVGWGGKRPLLVGTASAGGRPPLWAHAPADNGAGGAGGGGRAPTAAGAAGCLRPWLAAAGRPRRAERQPSTRQLRAPPYTKTQARASPPTRQPVLLRHSRRLL